MPDSNPPTARKRAGRKKLRRPAPPALAVVTEGGTQAPYAPAVGGCDPGSGPGQGAGAHGLSGYKAHYNGGQAAVVVGPASVVG